MDNETRRTPYTGGFRLFRGSDRRFLATGRSNRADHPLTEVSVRRGVNNESSHCVLLRVAGLNEDKGEACRFCTSILLVAVVARRCGSAEAPRSARLVVTQRASRSGRVVARCPPASRRTGPRSAASARPASPRRSPSESGKHVVGHASPSRRSRCLVVASAARASPVVRSAAALAGAAARRPLARAVASPAGSRAGSRAAGPSAAAVAGRAASRAASRSAVLAARAVARAVASRAAVVARVARPSATAARCSCTVASARRCG